MGAYFPHKVTYHPTCHSLRMLGVGDRPRRLLENLRGLRLVDLPGAEECCGFGGTFAMENADTSVAIGADKARNVRNTGAQVLVAGDNAGRQATTIEGVDEDDSVAESFDRHHTYQCGYCLPGMVLTVKAMLTEGACGSRGQTTEGLGGSLCRYGWYVKIVDAIEECAR